MTIKHGTTVELNGLGIFITGNSGSGKSDLAIRLINHGATLITDDYAILSVSNNKLTAQAPKNIQGKIEVFGIGIIDINFKEQTTLNLVVQLVESENLERMPETNSTIIENITLPRIYLCAKHASSLDKLIIYLKSLE